MDFSKLICKLKDDGEEWILYRPGISFDLFYDSPLGEIGRSLALIIEDYLTFIAPDSIEKYLGASGYKKLSKKTITTYLGDLNAAEAGDEFYELHLGSGVEPGPGYAVHLKASGLADRDTYPFETNRLTLEFPPDILDKKGVEPLVEFLIGCANRHPFYYGIAGYAFQHSVMTMVDHAQERIAKAAMRYLAFDISYGDIRYELDGHIHNVSWMNFLGSTILDKLGGAKKVQALLPGGAVLTPLQDGAVVRVAPLPPVGDVNKGASDLLPLKAFAKIAKPLRIETDYLGSDDDDFAERWLRRLD
jgi:hypothetical protein